MVTLDFITLSGPKPQILTPKRYDDHPRHFYMGVPPGHDVSSWRITNEKNIPTDPAMFRFDRNRRLLPVNFLSLLMQANSFL